MSPPPGEGRAVMVFAIPADAKPTPCRSCGASIVFILTAQQRRMPVDASGPHRGESHFAHCDDPRRFRKRDRVKGPRS